MSKTAQALAIAATCAAVSLAHAQAAKSALTFEFLEPTGQASANDSIVVNLRLTNTDASQPFSFDSSSGVVGLPASDLPATAWSFNPASQQWEQTAFASYTHFMLTLSFGCDGNSFTGSSCSGGAYTFNFAPSAFPANTPYQLGAGQSQDFTLGSFVPQNGSAPAGTYNFYNAKFWMGVEGVSADGRALGEFVTLASTCEAPFNNCTGAGQVFTRSIAAAVPEPATMGLMSLGLVGLIGVSRRRPAATRS
ncbi:MAG TPA: PEP-CTERM sorting domain-containing protein [Roseateles sp.]|nr:PEP-CTERM sorting domain-containing protein [Roseateles sp.]